MKMSPSFWISNSQKEHHSPNNLITSESVLPLLSRAKDQWGVTGFAGALEKDLWNVDISQLPDPSLYFAQQAGWVQPSVGYHATAQPCSCLHSHVLAFISLRSWVRIIRGQSLAAAGPFDPRKGQVWADLTRAWREMQHCLAMHWAHIWLEPLQWDWPLLYSPVACVRNINGQNP